MKTGRDRSRPVYAGRRVVGRHRFAGRRWLAMLLLVALLIAGATAAALLLPVGAKAGLPDQATAAGAASAFTPDFRPGEVIVEFAGETTSEAAAGLAKGADAMVAAEVAPVRGGSHFALVRSLTDSAEALLAKLQNAPGVVSVSLNYSRHVTVTPSDLLFSQQWGLNNTGQAGGLADADIDAPEAWNTTAGDSSVVVADIDSGVDYTHPDLAANMWRNLGEIPGDHLDNDGNGYVDDVYGIDTSAHDSDPMDQNGHGTHTSGTVAAVGDNGLGVTGVSWNTKIMALRFLDAGGSGWDIDAITCINYAIDMKLNHGVNVVAINASWGGGGNDAALRSAIAAAGNAGIVFCAAAGNGGSDGIGDNNDTTPFYPASFDLPSLISVAATTSSDALAGFSNYGSKSVDLGAPGVGILSTVPVWSVPPATQPYASWGGTSMATPHVAGTVALLAAQAPGDSLKVRIGRILGSVDPKSALSGKSVTGGRLNAAASLALQNVHYYEETSGGLVWAGTWTTRSDAQVSGGAYKDMNSSTASVTAPFNGTGISYVARRASGLGSARITLDGVVVATVNLSSAPTGYQQTVWRVAGLPAGNHTLKIDRGGSIFSTSAVNVDAFCVLGTLVVPPPVISSLSPASGSFLGGTAVTITGTGFNGASAVTFAGVPAESFQVVNATRITAVAPANPLGPVQVEVTTAGGVSADTAAGLFTYIYAPRRYEQIDPDMYVFGLWKASNSSSYSGGSYLYTTSPGSMVTASFNGTEVYYIARMSSSQGVAHITVDGVDQGNVSLYSATTKYKQTVWGISGLSPGDHTLVIEYTGLKGAGGGVTINVDAIDVMGTLTYAPRPNRYEENAPSLVYSPAWPSSNSTSYSGGRYRYTSSANAKVTIAFDGTAVDYIDRTSSNQGVARVTLDGVVQGTVSLYSSATYYRQKVWGIAGLDPGYHTLVIERTGSAGAGGGTTINLDAVDVIGVLVPVT